jgi:hypothetical protein
MPKGNPGQPKSTEHRKNISKAKSVPCEHDILGINNCKPCLKKYRATYYQRNKEKIKSNRRKYYQNNKEEINRKRRENPTDKENKKAYVKHPPSKDGGI